MTVQFQRLISEPCVQLQRSILTRSNRLSCVSCWTASHVSVSFWKSQTIRTFFVKLLLNLLSSCRLLVVVTRRMLTTDIEVLSAYNFWCLLFSLSGVVFHTDDTPALCVTYTQLFDSLLIDLCPKRHVLPLLCVVINSSLAFDRLFDVFRCLTERRRRRTDWCEYTIFTSNITISTLPCLQNDRTQGRSDGSLSVYIPPTKPWYKFCFFSLMVFHFSLSRDVFGAEIPYVIEKYS